MFSRQATKPSGAHENGPGWRNSISDGERVVFNDTCTSAPAGSPLVPRAAFGAGEKNEATAEQVER